MKKDNNETERKNPDINLFSEDQDPMIFTIEEAQAGERLDKYTTECIEAEAAGSLHEQADAGRSNEGTNRPGPADLTAGVSRTQVQEWIKNGAVLVNGRIAKANYKLAVADVVTVIVPDPEEAHIEPQDIPLDVVYEDGDVIVIDKPRGMVVHPAPGHYSGTLVNALMHHCTDLSGINGVMRPGIVHRIDKDTSGLIMAAKNDMAHASLAAQLKAHTVTRKYMALVHGNMPHENGTVDAPIGRDPQDRKLFTVIHKGSKEAVTHFQVVERFGDYTLLELQLETGRTHQIRVHMKYIEHPLAGDPVYGRNKTIGLKGQALHAAVLGFVHPRSGEYLEFQAPIPADMEHELMILRQR